MRLPIIKIRKITYSISGICILASIVFLALFGLIPGIDFTGGTLMQLRFTEARPNIDEVQTSLSALPTLGSVQVQPTDTASHMLKMRFITDDEYTDILATLRADFATEENYIIEERLDTIGPSISEQLRSRTITAVIAVVLATIAYIAYAFRNISKTGIASWKYGVVATLGILHNVVITLGVFAILGRYFGVEVDIPFVVALLTIMAYSVNDTIVVFDRIREIQMRQKQGKKFADVVEEGVSASLPRSINTTITTLAVLFALFLFGGPSVHYFSLALIIGIAVGAYSSLFLASPLLYDWYLRKKR